MINSNYIRHISSVSFKGSRGRNTGYPMPPAQIPACGFPAPGSSVIVTRAVSLMDIARKKVGSSTSGPTLSGASGLCRLPMTVTPFPM